MAPDQEKAVQAWAKGARNAFDTAETLFEKKKYDHALFFCHLALEKAMKSRYFALKDKRPPYTHDLVYLAREINPTLAEEYEYQLAEINTFNVSARYEEEKLGLYKKATPTYASTWFTATKELLEKILP